MKRFPILALMLICLGYSVFAQRITNIEALQLQSLKYAKEYEIKKAEAIEFAARNNIPVIFESEKGIAELQYIQDGIPQYNVTDNAVAAASIATDDVYSGGVAGLSLSGSGITPREWDVGPVLLTHQEFGGRASIGDASTLLNFHPTHVAGTIIATGFDPLAKGMAYEAELIAFDWGADLSEMAAEAADGMLMSNHSYSYIRGWNVLSSSWVWYGNTSISAVEDYLFGFYDNASKQWDQVAYEAPYYLICKSAGNDRNQGPGTDPPNDGPYDCIGQRGVAKNILTVGAVNDLPGGYSGPESVVMSSFSSWGPADDGRIKPDICANGVGLYSAYNSSDNAYASSSGTSMATPSVTGSLALLQEHYENLNGAGNYLLASTLKALVIHTADEAGSNPGPDYEFGWGLMNTRTAADKISEDYQIGDVISELELEQDGTYSREVMALGTQPLKVTIVWTDVPGTPVAAQLDPVTPMLVNDLDLRISQGSNTYYPWKMDRDNPSFAATNTMENDVDNVEVVFVENPEAVTYTIKVDHDGTLQEGPQAFSMIISGMDLEHPPHADFIASTLAPAVGEPVDFTDLSLGYPTSWNWSFTGPGDAVFVNGGNPTVQSPTVQFTEPGLYSVSLVAGNSYGTDHVMKSAYIDVHVCDPCISGSSNLNFFWISNVTFNTINNSSSSAGYSDYKALITDLSPESMYSISVSVTTSSIGDYPEDVGVFIDWNRDCDLTDPGESYFFEEIIGSGTLNTDIAVPAHAISGPVLMRVIVEWEYAPEPCGGFTYGETEDYTLNILNRTLDVKAFLEGPYNGAGMNVGLSQQIPLTQPFNTSPWYYLGLENVAVIPNENIVDWVLLELRDATSATSATDATLIGRQACFLLNDGSVTGPDGSSRPEFGLPVSNGLYVVLRHHNHLGILSNSFLSSAQGLYSYDFTSGINQVFGGSSGHKQIGSGIWGMIAGDGDRNGTIDSGDKTTLWDNESGSGGYINTDYNLDGQSNNNDKDDYWLPNTGKGTQVPD